MIASLLLTTLIFGAQDPATVGADPPSAATPDQAPDQVYKRGKNQFDFGDCANSITTLAPLAVPGSLGDERQQLDVHRMLGVCYALGGRQLESAREFSSLLSIDPDASLDPFLTPPSAVEVFDRQKATMKAQLEEIRRARDRARAGTLDEGALIVEHTQITRDVPFASVFLPFGLAQAANGDTVKAVIIGSIQGAALITNVSAYWVSIANGDSTSDELRTHQIAWYTHVGAAMALVLSYGYGVADALWSYESQKVVTDKRTKRPATPEELKALEKIPAPATQPAGTAPPAPSPL